MPEKKLYIIGKKMNGQLSRVVRDDPWNHQESDKTEMVNE